MRRTAVALTAVAACLFSCGCSKSCRVAKQFLGNPGIGEGLLETLGCPMARYSGDGILIDNGAGAATDRYVLNLGTIDLTRRGQRIFRFKGLPELNFVVGIEINATDPTVMSNRSINPTVSILLSDSSGKAVFSKRLPLHSWTWSVPLNGQTTAFVYGREEPATYFNALPNVEYVLAFEVVAPDHSGLKCVSALTAKTGGWK